MKVGIYQDVGGPAINGTNAVVMALASALASDHEVTVLHHSEELAHDDAARYLGVDLHGAMLRYLPQDLREGRFTRPWARARLERERYAKETRQFDLLIASVAGMMPPFCHAPRGALYIHFPFFDRRETWPWTVRDRGPKAALRRWLANREWAARFRGYGVVLVNSAFTQGYVRDWWGLSSTVVYAPTVPAAAQAERRNRILSVGRFTERFTPKRQLQLAQAFTRLRASSSSVAWEYHTVGGLNGAPENVAYYERVRAEAARTGAIVQANLTRSELDALYATSKVFWHAAGFGVPGEDPRRHEHFGIVTAEAMSAGCVPVAFRGGGQPEIVEHGESGFLWSTLDELLAYTRRLEDPVLWARMSAAAQARAAHFSASAFRTRVQHALSPLLGVAAHRSLTGSVPGEC